MQDEGEFDALRALPVLIQVSHAREASLRRYVDGVLGWQPIGLETPGPFRARVRLTDDPAMIDETLPAVLLVDDHGVSARDAKQLARHASVSVCLWPSERDQLESVVAEVLHAHTSGPGVRVLTVGGAAGGVGATTLALTLGGISAWQGRTTLVAVNDVSFSARDVSGSALTDPALWEQATPLAGVDGCRVVHVNDGPPATRVGDLRISQSVYDMGVSHDVDVLVLRPDRAGRFALDRTTASIAIVVGSGVFSPAQIREVAGSRRVVAVEQSARVARAIAHKRIPAGLPGTWLQPLVDLVRSEVVFATG
ncbi:MAG: hypothetical protein WD360_04280 [Nitriliruptoraceae bacterium]